MNGEKGQALPLAILALLAGMLLVAPFLGHASASMIGSRTYADAISYRNACDAGVEHAIWRLVYDDMGILIPNYGDQITYQLPEEINNVTPTITVTNNSTGGGGAAIGEIDGIIDTLEYDYSSGYEPSIIQVSADVYAIAYRGEHSDGTIKTVSIDEDGNIGSSPIDSLVFEGGTCKYTDFTYVTGDIYAVAYQGSGLDCYIKTFTIDSDGDIGSSTIDTMAFFADNGREPIITQITSSIYAIVYRGFWNYGYITTISINANGFISDFPIDTMIFDFLFVQVPTLIHASGNVYALAYQGFMGSGFIKTISIDESGNINDFAIDTLQFDYFSCKYVDIIQISEEIFAVAYQGHSDNGYIKTFSIDENGDIGNSVIDTLQFDSDGRVPCIIYISGDVYAIVFQNYNRGVVKTVSIDASGNIDDNILDSFMFESNSGQEPDVIQVSSGIIVVVYRGPNNDGYIITIQFATGPVINSYRILASAGDTTIEAYVNIDGLTAYIFLWKIQ